MKKILILFVFSFFTSVVFAGGGWISKKGEGFMKLGQSVISADELFGANGDKISLTTTSVYITDFYAEYGIGKNMEVMMRLPIFFRTTINEVRFRSGKDGIPGDEFNYFGDPSIGLKYGIIRDKPFVLSASLRLDFPLGRTDGGNSNLIQTGDGEFNQLLRFEGGYGFKNGKVYMTGGLGYNNRSDGFSGEIHYNYEAGYKINDAFTFIGKLYGIESLENGTVAGNGSGIFSNDMEQLLITPQLLFEFSEVLGLEAATSFPVSGQNILASPIYQFGVFLKVK